MQTKRISVRNLFIISVLLLLFTNIVTYVLLLNKNEEWKTVLADKSMYSSDAFVAAEALAEHVYYDGEFVPSKQKVRHYRNSGKLVGVKSLGEILHGDKVLMLLSPNSCSSCAKAEMEKLLKLSETIGRNHVVFVADYAMHLHKELAMCFDEEGYLETDVEHLGLKGSPSRETPVVMLTHNGRVKTSFPVGQQTIEFTDGFHDYLVEYFKGKK